MEQNLKSIALHLLLWTPVLAGALRDDVNRVKVKPSIVTLNTNGYELTNNAYVGAWLLRIMKGDKFACGASYYSEFHAISSASCMHKYKEDLDNLSVEFMSGNEFSLIQAVYVSKHYKWPSNYMDIAVLKLVYPMRGYHSAFVKLCSKSPQSYAKLTVVGCGSEKQEVTTQQVSHLNKMECSEDYNTISLSETVICTHAFNHAEECVYDFGCPVTVGDELCGVVAYGPACNDTGLPGLITDIFAVKKFIKQAIDAEHKVEGRTKSLQSWMDK